MVGEMLMIVLAFLRLGACARDGTGLGGACHSSFNTMHPKEFQRCNTENREALCQ
jgi:hypothetical protein